MRPGMKFRVGDLDVEYTASTLCCSLVNIFKVGDASVAVDDLPVSTLFAVGSQFNGKSLAVSNGVPQPDYTGGLDHYVDLAKLYIDSEIVDLSGIRFVKCTMDLQDYWPYSDVTLPGVALYLFLVD